MYCLQFYSVFNDGLFIGRQIFLLISIPETHIISMTKEYIDHKRIQTIHGVLIEFSTAIDAHCINLFVDIVQDDLFDAVSLYGSEI